MRLVWIVFGFLILPLLPATATPERTAVLAELERLNAACGAGAAELWDIDFCGATLFVDRNTGEALSYVLKSGRALKPEQLKEVHVPDDFPIANTTKYWRGRQWAVIVWPMQGDITDRLALMLHESYHRTQGVMHFGVGRPASGVHLDDAPGRISLRLEARAMAAALSATSPASEAQHIRRALDFRALRIAGNERAQRAERYQNLYEGLAEYTGHKLARGAAGLRAHAAARMTELESLDEFDRNYAYFIAPAWAALLDARAPGWRPAMTGDDDLADVMARALRYHASPPPLDQLVAFGADYRAAEITTMENTRQAQVEVVRDGYRERFLRKPVLVLTPESFAIDPRTEVSLGVDGRFFRIMDMHGRWGSLKTWAGAMLGPRPPYVYVEAIEENGQLKLEDNEHWTLELKPGWHIVPHERGYALERIS